MADFVKADYTIYHQKQDDRDDQSTLSSRSPNRRTSHASNSRGNMMRSIRAAGGIYLAKQASMTVAQDIAESTGNETLMNDIANVGTVGAVGIMAAKAPPVAVAYGLQQGIQTFANYRKMERSNADKRFKEQLWGARTNGNRVGKR